jgi:polyphosphate kinase 2
MQYEADLRELEIELIKLQNWVVGKNKRLLVLFEGNEFAGKGTAIRTIMEHLNPRYMRLVALPKPTPEEEGQWYFQRYMTRLPEPGQIVLSDRSWYNRAVVEPVNGFCTEKQYQKFMSAVTPLERILCEDGILLIKLYLSVGKKVQARRIQMIRKNVLRRWELTQVDESAQELWDVYKKYEKRMLEETHTDFAPWTVIDANVTWDANLAAIRRILEIVPYQ